MHAIFFMDTFSTSTITLLTNIYSFCVFLGNLSEVGAVVYLMKEGCLGCVSTMNIFNIYLRNNKKHQWNLKKPLDRYVQIYE